jgi:hypothetical protein
MDGAILEDRIGEWHRIIPAPLSGRISPAIGSGGEYLFVWGGNSVDGTILNDGAVYRLGSKEWRHVAQSPLSPRTGATCGVGRERAVVWGGTTRADSRGSPLVDGATYDFAANAWSYISPGAWPVTRMIAHFWDRGRLFVVWSRPVRPNSKVGHRASASRPRSEPYTAGRPVHRVSVSIFDPDKERWTETSASPLAIEALRVTTLGDQMLAVSGDGQTFICDLEAETAKRLNPLPGGEAAVNAQIAFRGAGTFATFLSSTTADLFGWVIDDLALEWVAAPSVPKDPRRGVASAAQNSRVVIWGGATVQRDGDVTLRNDGLSLSARS